MGLADRRTMRRDEQAIKWRGLDEFAEHAIGQCSQGIGRHGAIGNRPGGEDGEDRQLAHLGAERLVVEHADRCLKQVPSDRAAITFGMPCSA